MIGRYEQRLIDMAFEERFPTLDNTTIWFQYKILYNILPTRNYLYNLKIVDSDLCGLCGLRIETIIHLFTECPIVNVLWDNMRQWVSNKTHIYIKISKIEKLFGYLIQNQHFWQINFILLITRKYIFRCSQKKTKPDMDMLKKEIKNAYDDQVYLSRVNFSESIFDKKWNKWKDIFD